MSSMTTALPDKPQAAHSKATGPRAVIATFVRTCVAQIRLELRIRNGVHTMMSLDDHMLDDIGIGRRSIKRAARRGWKYDGGERRV